MITALDEKMVSIALCGVRCTVLTLSALYGHFSAYFPIPFRLVVCSCLASVTVYVCMLCVVSASLYGTRKYFILDSLQINDFYPLRLLCCS